MLNKLKSFIKVLLAETYLDSQTCLVIHFSGITYFFTAKVKYVLMFNNFLENSIAIIIVFFFFFELVEWVSLSVKTLVRPLIYNKY